MASRQLKIGFLIIEKHSGNGGLENVLVDVIRGLEKFNIESIALFLQSTENDFFHHKFEHIMILDNVQKNAIYKYLPKIIQHNIWKYQFKKSVSRFFENKISCLGLDALIVLNISRNFVRILPTIEEYKELHPKIPIIAWPHSSFQPYSSKLIEKFRKNLNVVDNIFAISQGISDEFKAISENANHIVVHNPIKASSKKTRNIRKFLFIGRVNDPRKRVKEILDVLTKVSGDWHFDIVGGSGSTKGDVDFQEYIRSLGLQEKVTFYGWQESPWDVIRDAGVLILNSLNEGFGLVLVEAMMRGIPCLSTDCPVGPNEIIRDGVNGWLYPVHQPEILQKYLQEIMDGERVLPDQDVVIESVQKFSEENVLANFRKALDLAIEEKRSK